MIFEVIACRGTALVEFILLITPLLTEHPSLTLLRFVKVTSPALHKFIAIAVINRFSIGVPHPW